MGPSPWLHIEHHAYDGHDSSLPAGAVVRSGQLMMRAPFLRMLADGQKGFVGNALRRKLRGCLNTRCVPQVWMAGLCQACPRRHIRRQSSPTAQACARSSPSTGICPAAKAGSAPFSSWSPERYVPKRPPKADPSMASASRCHRTEASASRCHRADAKLV
eukprot:365999-Chlamydomonas_euryale.AAC.5